MGKIAFLFSGQGAQCAGMGKSFYESSETVKDLFGKCENLRPGTLEAMFSGTDEQLKDTKTTQPCLYLCDLAAAIAANDAGINPDAVCGFSLGEIPALAFAGSYTYEKGFELVCARASAMAKAAEKNPACMCAVVKLTNEQVAEACAIDDVYPVNFNCAGQVSVSYKAEKAEELEKNVRSLGGRVLPLKVSGGFHSPFMDEAAEEFAEVLENAGIVSPKITAYSNVTARPYEDDVVSVLRKQINHPVKWEDTIKHLAENGYDTFIETGVGSTLKKLVSKILPEAKVFAVNDAESLSAVKEELGL